MILKKFRTQTKSLFYLTRIGISALAFHVVWPHVKYSAEGYQQEVGDVDDGDDTEEELEPLINGNDESREENEPDDSKVKFVTQDQEPVESRLK